MSPDCFSLRGWQLLKCVIMKWRHGWEINAILITRMHSSRMRTVCCSGRWGGGHVSQHALGRGVYPSMHWVGVGIPACTRQGGVCPGSVCLGGLPDTPLSPCEQNDWWTAVKTLPCRSFVADGNIDKMLHFCSDTYLVAVGVTFERSYRPFFAQETSILLQCNKLPFAT